MDGQGDTQPDRGQDTLREEDCRQTGRHTGRQRDTQTSNQSVAQSQKRFLHDKLGEKPFDCGEDSKVRLEGEKEGEKERE